MHKSKKLISIVAAATLALSAAALSACSSKGGYKGEDLVAGYTSEATVASNGGFVVEKGEFVYFINGSAASTANNTYGKVVKGSLMRLSKTDMAAGKYQNAQILVPSLMVAGDYDAGLYIFGDYIYYATPSNVKNNDGEIENSRLDFKRCKLNGKHAPEQIFRLTSNTAKYRFVEEGNQVYCLFEEDSKLKSYNVETGKTTVLVSGASSFVYNKADATDPNVYYTMGVTYDVELENASTAPYNQIYCVNAAATAKTDKATASYTVYEGETKIASYDFDEKAMKDAEDKEYDLGDYTTYPYVNLGKLVLDGVGIDDFYHTDKRFNVNKEFSTEATSMVGYSYTLQQQGNGGIYFTRTNLTLTQNGGTDPEAAFLRYLPATGVEGNTVTQNDNLQTVAKESTNASAAALFRIDEGVHSYFYVSGTSLKKITANADGSKASEIELTNALPSEAALWQEVDGYLYYTAAGTNGKSVGRIRADGTAANYESFDKDKGEYAPFNIKLVDFYDSWYKPEFVTDKDGVKHLFFANAQAYGTQAGTFYYIYGVKLDKLVERNEAIEAVEDEIDEYKDNTQIQEVMKYYYRTGKTAAYDAVKDLYNDDQQTYFTEFKAKFEGDTPTLTLESKHLGLVGRMIDEDIETINEGWANALLKETEEDTEKEGLPTWAIVLIVVGSVVVVAAGVAIPLLVVRSKKKAKKRREEAIVSAYKHKRIDTTDDKSIDVYADEEEAEPVQEEVVEESVEEASQTEEEPVNED